MINMFILDIIWSEVVENKILIHALIKQSLTTEFTLWMDIKYVP